MRSEGFLFLSGGLGRDRVPLVFGRVCADDRGVFATRSIWRFYLVELSVSPRTCGVVVSRGGRGEGYDLARRRASSFCVASARKPLIRGCKLGVDVSSNAMVI